jgi:hypothetical protein
MCMWLGEEEGWFYCILWWRSKVYEALCMSPEYAVCPYATWRWIYCIAFGFEGSYVFQVPLSRSETTPIILCQQLLSVSDKYHPNLLDCKALCKRCWFCISVVLYPGSCWARGDPDGYWQLSQSFCNGYQMLIAVTAMLCGLTGPGNGMVK